MYLSKPTMRIPKETEFSHAAASCFSLSAWNQSFKPVMNTRWSPTPEQLQTLEEIYRHGVRTPSPEQIQSIVSKLRRFGRIEGKNVFYWFQNHKAREKQRKRRRLELQDFYALQQRKWCSGGIDQSSDFKNHYQAAAAQTPCCWPLEEFFTAQKGSETAARKTLDLFPIVPFRAAAGKEENHDDDDDDDGISEMAKPVPNQFFEFLPIPAREF